MAARTPVPVEVYLRTAYEPEREYVGGELLDRHVGDYSHGLLQASIAGVLGSREHERGFRAFIAVRVRGSDEPRYRVPDICVKAWPHEITPILTCPDLAIEVLSPEDRAGAMLAKIADYLAAGIPYVWVVDPYKRLAMAADHSGIHRPPGLVLSTPLVGEVDFAALFQ